MLNHPSIPEMNSTWLWCVILLVCICVWFVVFCWGFLHLHPSGILACGSFIPVVSLSGFDIRVILASYNESGSVPSSSMLWKSLREGLKLLFRCVVEFASDAICSLAFLCWEVLIPESISLFVIGLFRFSVPSWLRKVGRLYVSNNLCISSKWSTFLVYNCGLFVFLWYEL